MAKSMEQVKELPKGNLKKKRCKSAPQSPQRYHTRHHDFRDPVTIGNRDLMEQPADEKKTLRKKQVKLTPTISMPIDECRKVFQQEILVLWQEVSDFRKTCHDLMAKQRASLQEGMSRPSSRIGASPAPGGRGGSGSLSKDLQVLERNMEFLQKHQGLLNREQVLMDKEEKMAERQQKLQAYEQEIEEVEDMLDKRQVLCEKRTKDVEVLNEEVLIMKQGLQSDLDTLDMLDENKNTHLNSPMASERARRNWSIARRNLIDKVTMLEATVQRYRTEVASATTTITAKDMTITRLSQQISALSKDMEAKDRRIKQLESQLSLTVQEQQATEKQFEMLMDELQNMDFSSSSYKLQHQQQQQQQHQQQTHSTSAVSQKVGRKLFKKQNSTASLFGGSGGGTSLSNGESRSKFSKSAESVWRDSNGRAGHDSHRDDTVGNHSNKNGGGPPQEFVDEEQGVITPRTLSPKRELERSKACSIM